MSVPLPPSEMPYARSGGCDICGARVPLHRVVLKESSGAGVNGNYRCARVAYICDEHADGDPMRAPNSTMAEGTSRLHPQEETLL